MTTPEIIVPVIRAQGVTKRFEEGDNRVDVLNGVDIQIHAGKQLAIIGASGTGKSTLLHILGGLEHPSEGTVEICGQNIDGMSAAQRGRLRNAQLGFIYQFHHLLPEFTAQENVAMPLLIRRMKPTQALKAAAALLTKVGLSHRLTHKPGELSGGERQRAAVARALVTKPACVLADEPTGNLDERTASGVHQLMMELNSQNGTALVVVTHDLNLAGQMSSCCRLIDGTLQPA